MTINFSDILVDSGGYIGGFSPESEVVFTKGVGIITPAPRVVFQAVTQNTEFIWENVFSDILPGTGSEVPVDYYIRSDGAKVFGVQKRGSQGQPIIPNSGEPPGKIVLKDLTVSGVLLVNFAVEMPNRVIQYGTPYEGWPFWRFLHDNERASAGDAIHWLFDSFDLMVAKEPSNVSWANARAQLLASWERACLHASDTTKVFKKDTRGSYTNFPLTSSYAYGATKANDLSTSWSAVNDPTKYTATRDPTTGYVVVELPKEDGAFYSEDPVRHGWSFENSPLFLYAPNTTQIAFDIKSDVKTICTIKVENTSKEVYINALFVPNTETHQTIPIDSLSLFQQLPGDATGDKTGDWIDPNDIPMPVINPVAFPGRRVALMGDSLSFPNSTYYGGLSNRGMYNGFSASGYLTNAMMLMGYPLELEPSLQPTDPPVAGDNNVVAGGYNFSVSGSKVTDWEETSFIPYPGAPAKPGPMHKYRTFKDKVDIVCILGGTNDIAANISHKNIMRALKKYVYEMAVDGKWVFWLTLPPRTTSMLVGYTSSEASQLQNRIIQVNEAIREVITTLNPPNVFLVDTWDALVGPNGIDPHGWVSSSVNPTEGDTEGNWKTGVPQIHYFYDGLHLTNAGAAVIGAKLAQVMQSAGIPARVGKNRGPLTASSNLLPNPGFAITSVFPTGGWSRVLGRSRCLGNSLTDATHVRPSGISVYNNLGLGYTHGQVPDYWYIYKLSNNDGEAYSNFNAYMYEGFMGIPEVIPYTHDSTWEDGCLKVTKITHAGKPALRLNFSTPVTGKKNEGFILKAYIPGERNGPWNNWGWDTWPQTPNPTNNLYSPGDYIGAELLVEMEPGMQNLHSMLLESAFLSVDEVAVSNGDPTTSLAAISGLCGYNTFLPMSAIDAVRFSQFNTPILLQTPISKAPTPAGVERPYMELVLKVSLDASTSAASVSLIVSDPYVSKYTGGSL